MLGVLCLGLPFMSRIGELLCISGSCSDRLGLSLYYKNEYCSSTWNASWLAVVFLGKICCLPGVSRAINCFSCYHHHQSGSTLALWSDHIGCIMSQWPGRLIPSDDSGTEVVLQIKKNFFFFCPFMQWFIVEHLKNKKKEKTTHNLYLHIWNDLYYQINTLYIPHSKLETNKRI